PPHFVTRRGSMIASVHFQWIEKDAGRIIILIPCRIALAPGRERFPAKRHNDLLAPVRLVRRKPRLSNTASVAVETKLPWPVQVHPIDSLNGAALAVGSRIFGPGIRA